MDITIYGKPGCGGCTTAKNWLDAQSIPYDYKELGTDFMLEEIQALAPQSRSFPVIFVNGSNVGGYPQLVSRVMTESAFPGNGPTLLTE